MSLRQAIKGLIVVVAVVFGTSANAFAHANQAHAQSSASPPSIAAAADMVTAQPVADISGVLVRPSPVQLDEAAAEPGPFVRSAVFRSDGAACPPGACCCQGASASCGMGGHCCASTAPENTKWASGLSNHMRYHLARLGSVYPDVVFGLDRPPKA